MPALVIDSRGQHFVLAGVDGERLLILEAHSTSPEVCSIEQLKARSGGRILLFASRASLTGEFARFDFSWFIPAVVKYTTQLASSLTAVRTACEEADVSVQKELLLETSDKLSEMKVALAALKDILAKASAIKDNKEKAFAYLHEVCPAMVALRKPADELEMLVDKELWPFPSYGDLVFEV